MKFNVKDLGYKAFFAHILTNCTLMHKAFWFYNIGLQS